VKYRYTYDWHYIDSARSVIIRIPASDDSVIYSTGRRHTRRKANLKMYCGFRGKYIRYKLNPLAGSEQNLIMITDPICCFSLSFKSKIKHYLPQPERFTYLTCSRILRYTLMLMSINLRLRGENRNKAGVYR